MTPGQAVNSNCPTRRRTIGMDMVAPYGVYLNGKLMAEHSTEKEAASLFDALRERSRTERIFVGQSFKR
jgi:hypothetical protein